MSRHLQRWLEGLLGAAISGFTTVLSGVFIDPSYLWINGDKLLKIAFMNGVVGALLFLRQRPLPSSFDSNPTAFTKPKTP